MRLYLSQRIFRFRAGLVLALEALRRKCKREAREMLNVPNAFSYRDFNYPKGYKDPRSKSPRPR